MIDTRNFACGLVTAWIVCTSSLAWGQTYPARPVHLLVGYAPGGANDSVARLMAQWLSERLGQTFVVENRPGAASNTATEVVVRSPPDGYTLFLVNASNAINASLYDKLHYNFIRDIVPVAGIMRVPNVMEVNSSFPAKTVSEFIAYGKSNPGTINFVSGGIGTSDHLAGELFKMTSLNMTHIPYRGEGPALTDVLGGQLQLIFGTAPASVEQIRAGRLRALAVTTAARSDALPNIPTLSEFLPGYEASSWYGVGAPRTRSTRTSISISSATSRPWRAPSACPTSSRSINRCLSIPSPGSSPMPKPIPEG